jgi:hypothetical protein
VRPPAVEHAVVLRQEAAAARGAAVLRQEEAAARGAAVGPPAAEHAVVPQQEEAVAEQAAEVEAVQRQEAPGVPVARPSGAPWAAVWACHRDQALPWPVQRPKARSARAMEQRPIAWP